MSEHDDCQGKCDCYQRGYVEAIEDTLQAGPVAGTEHIQDQLDQEYLNHNMLRLISGSVGISRQV